MNTDDIILRYIYFQVGKLSKHLQCSICNLAIRLGAVICALAGLEFYHNTYLVVITDLAQDII